MGPSISKAVTKNVNETITKITSNAIQSSVGIQAQFQGLTVKCDQNFWNAFDKCHQRIFDLVDRGKTTTGEATAAIEKVCPVCSASNINMKGAISSNITTDQKAKIDKDIRENLAVKLKQDIQNETGLRISGTNVETEIENVVRTVLEQTDNVVQQLNNTASQTQQITVEGSSKEISFITMDIVNELVVKNIQDASAVTKVVKELATSVEQQAKSGGGGILKTVMIIVGIIIGLLVILGLVLWIIKRNKNKKLAGDTMITGDLGKSKAKASGKSSFSFYK